MAFMVNGQIRVKTKPYVIPHSEGMPESMVTALTKSHSQIIRLKGQIAASKAIGSLLSMREMVATERAMKVAGIPLEQVKHGFIVPTTGTARALIAQKQLLTKATKQTTVIGTEVLAKTARVEILTEKWHEQFAEITRLRQALRDRPTVTEQKMSFDWGLPSLEDLKTPLIIAGVTIAGLIGLSAVLKR